MRLVIEARLAGEGNDTDHGADGVLAVIARLDQFLCRNGVATDERVTVISDDADKFAKMSRAGRILDWFHIAMKFKAVDGDERHDGA